MPNKKAWTQERATKYANEFIKEKYDRVNLTLKKGEKDNIKLHAEKQGETLNGFINRAINETMQRDNSIANEPSNPK